MKTITILFCALLLLLVGAVVLFLNDLVEPARFAISTMTALGVIFAVMSAIYGERIRAYFSPMRLKVEAVENHDNFKNQTNVRGRQEDVITYHLSVRNMNLGRPAKNCCVKLIKYSDENHVGTFSEKTRFAVPRTMVWAPSENDPTERTIYDSEILDFGNLFLSDGEFRLKFHSKQGGTFEPECKLGTRRQYVFRVTAEGLEKPQDFNVTIRSKGVSPNEDWRFSYALDVQVG